jgi:hypothetical protein
MALSSDKIERISFQTIQGLQIFLKTLPNNQAIFSDGKYKHRRYEKLKSCLARLYPI